MTVSRDRCGLCGGGTVADGRAGSFRGKGRPDLRVRSAEDVRHDGPVGDAVKGLGALHGRFDAVPARREHRLVDVAKVGRRRWRHHLARPSARHDAVRRRHAPAERMARRRLSRAAQRARGRTTGLQAGRLPRSVHRVQGVVQEGPVDDVSGAVVLCPEPCGVDVRVRRLRVVPLELRREQVAPVPELSFELGELAEGPGRVFRIVCGGQHPDARRSAFAIRGLGTDTYVRVCTGRNGRG